MNSDKPSHVVHLHTVSLDIPVAELDACRRLLSADEIAKADRFARESPARRWLVSRARLRQVLADYCGTSPASLRFHEQEFGKPALDASVPGEAVHFNLSHSRDLAVVAVTNIGPVGVDVEFERTIIDWASVASRFFSPLEQAQLADLDAGQRQQAFYYCWTRKEAVIKATGEGLSARLDSFDVSLLPNAAAEVLADRRAGRTKDRWQLQHIEPKPGYVGAIAIRSSRAIEVNYNPDWLRENLHPL